MKKSYAGVLETGRLPNERKIAVHPLDNLQKRDHPCTDAVYLFGGYPMRPLRPRPRHLLGAERRRALEMLAATELNGCSGAALLGQGFRVGMLADLVSDGLVTAHRETMKGDERKTARVRIRITDAGRQALEG